MPSLRTLNEPLRTSDVARQAACSVQQIRNLERDGVLGPTVRTATGYRCWTDTHVVAAKTYGTLAAAMGPVQAKHLMRLVRTGTHEQMLAAIDAAHASFSVERRDVELALKAVEAITAEPMHDLRSNDAMTISELGTALGVPPSTLRFWEHEGLLIPARRSDRRGARVYSPSDVRDARIVHQLRLAGYRIPPLRDMMPALRRGGRPDDITKALRTRTASINSRSRALLQSATGLLALQPPETPRH